MIFLHQGQSNIKEIRFHPYFKTMIATTAEDSQNIFRPNVLPDDDEQSQNSEEEEKYEQEVLKTAKKANKPKKDKITKRQKHEDDIKEDDV